MKFRLDILCMFILFILTFISFSNFESEAKTINVTVIDASSDFVRVMLDIYGYTPNDKRVSVRIESTGGQFIQQTDLIVREKNDFMWGAQMSFIRTSSSGSSYNVFVYNEDGGFLGSTSFSLTGAPSSTSPSTSQPTITYYDTFLSLQVRDSSKGGYIQVKPTLTYGSGSKLSNYDVSIYVDGNYKARAFSNSWSNNIWAGTGSLTIKASVPERTDTSDSSIRYRASSDTETFFVSDVIGITYYDTQLSLQVTDGSSQGNIRVYPTLTYGSGTKLSITNISIFVGKIYKFDVSTNEWSSDIWAGDGSHTIRANFPETVSNLDSSRMYRSSSVTETFFVKTSSSVSSGSGSIGSGITSNENFPIDYVIVGIVIAVIAAGIGIGLSRRRKATPVISASPAKAQTTQRQDDTQFWVCPHCGGDTQYRNEKQYCSSCNVYL